MNARLLVTGLATVVLVPITAPAATAEEPPRGAVLRRAAAVDTFLTGPVVGPDTAHAEQRTLEVGGGTTTRRALLRFDLGLPARAVVRSARLHLVVTEAPAAPVTVEVRAPGAAWTSRATWRTSDGATPWPAEGGAPGPEAYGTAVAVTGSGPVVWDVTALAQGWLAGAPNHGVLLQETGSVPALGAASLGASEHPRADKRPLLELTYAAPPDAIGSVTATAGDAEVRASWQAPFDHGEAITGYSLRLLDREGGIVAAADTAGTEHTFAGVANGRAYVVEVFARNAVGTSEGARSASVTPEGSPTAPAGLAVSRAVGGLDAAWQPPDYGAPTAYVVRALRSDGSPAATLETTGTTASLRGLATGTAYTVEVRGRNAHGVGLPAVSEPVEPAGAPFAPANVQATPLSGGRSIAVGWTPADPNGAPVTAYGVTARRVPDGTVAATADVAGDATEATVTTLDPDTDYRVEVVARNAVGESPPAAAVTRTLGVPPGVPTVTGLAQSAARELTATWTAPASGATVEGYEVTARRESDGAVAGRATLPASADRWAVGSLEGGASYCVEVVATNTWGAGEAATACAVAGDVPHAPEGVGVAAGDYTATVTWAGAVERGAPVTAYVVRARAYDVDSAWSDVVRQVPADARGATLDLWGSTPYWFRVEAVTAVGASVSGWVQQDVGPLPAPVRDLVVVPLDGGVDVAWRLPEDPAQRAEWYEIAVYETGQEHPHVRDSMSASGRRIALGGLRDGVRHRIVVAAVRGSVSSDVEAEFVPVAGDDARLDEFSLYGGATELAANYDNGYTAWREEGRWMVRRVLGPGHWGDNRLAYTVEAPPEFWPAGARNLSIVGSDPAFDTDEPLAWSDTNGVSDVYLWAGGLQPMSVSEGNQEIGNGPSHSISVALSRDDLAEYYVAYRSAATNLDVFGGPADANGREDVYVSRVRWQDGFVYRTWRASVTEHGELDGGELAGKPSVDALGVTVFEHTGADASGVDANGVGDVYVADVDYWNDAAPAARLLLPGRRNGTHDPAVSWVGGYVLFRAERAAGEPPIAPGDEEGVPAWYRHHVETGTTELVVSGAASGVQIAPDGESVTYVSDGALWLRDFRNGGVRLVAGAEWQPQVGYANGWGGETTNVVWLGRDPALPGGSVRRTPLS